MNVFSKVVVSMNSFKRFYDNSQRQIQSGQF